MCYMVVEYLDAQSSKEHDSFYNSEWGSEAAEEMCNKVRGFAVLVERMGRC